ncbi:MAG: dockerin type I repeat-containing protein [Clostridia bacterium]|nr:dockerin type I repeat-containing protein [Clostridia bacterium]
MQKLFKRSLAILLVVMMVVTMFAGSFAIADTGKVLWRSMDRLAGCSGSPDRPEPTLETNNYMQGAGAFNYNLSGRTKTDLFWYADEGSTALEATTNITSAIDAEGKTVWAFDLYVTDAESFMGIGNIFSIQCYAAAAESKDVNNMNAWIELNTKSGGNASWTQDFGLENGLQDGWNHIAITIDTDEGENKYAHASNTRADYWNPEKLWKFRIVSENNAAPAEQTMILDDVRFMTPEYYASAEYASEIAAKEVIGLINEIEGKNDTEGMAAAKAAYDALSDAAKAKVINYSKYESLTAEPMSVQLHACDSSANTIMAAGFSKWVKTSLNRTEGKYSMRGTAPEGTVSIHFSFQSTDGWDFSKAEYLVFDFYYTGMSFNWVNGVNDQNIGLGPTTTWHDMGYGNITNAGMQAHMMSKLQPDKWNHVVIPLSAFNLTSDQLVHNLRFYWEGCVVAPSGTNQIWIDDIRIVNANGLETLVPEANAGKDLAQVISGLTVDNPEGIAAAKAAYEALSDTAKAAVFNASLLTDLDQATTLAPAFDAKVKELSATEITYADKAAVEALRAEYAALSATAQGVVTTLADLEAMEAIITAETEKAAAVVAAIEALPATDDIALSNKGAVEAARDAYTALADDTKVAVTNLAVLEAAEAKIKALEEAAGDAEKAAAVDAAIAALKDAADITVDDEAAIAAAEAMYNALTDAQKELVKADSLAKLSAVKAAAAQDKADREAAAAVDAKIAALPETVAVADKAEVSAARAAYDALNDKAKSYVTKLDILVADETAIATLEAAIAAAKAVEDQIAALPATITAADAAAVAAARAAYRALTAEAKGFVPNLATLEKAEIAIASLGAYDVLFRAFELADSDLNQANNTASGGLCNDGLVNKRAFQVVWDGSVSAADMHLYVYGYNQNNQNDDELYNPDGCSKLIVTDPDDLYVTFDLYVSDASVLVNAANNAANDCGFGLDTVQTGGANAWGNAGTTKNTFVRPVLQNLVDGWNHVVIPLTLSGAYIEADNSKRPIKAGDVLTVASLRLYCVGLTIPEEGFVIRMDDMHFMNSAGVAEINSLRSIAKDVTLAIQNYPAEATYDDFYAIYAKYMALPEEYQAVTKGWTEFAAANEAFATQAAEQFPADKDIAAAVDAMIAPFADGVTLDDKAEVSAARAAYNELTDIQKNMILKVEILVAAEKSIADQQIVADTEAAAKAVSDMIAALPAADELTIEDKAAVEAARAAYTALTDDQKKMVKGLLTLRAAESAIAEIERLMAAAQPVIDMIAALPATKDITKDDASAIEAAREAYDNLDDEVQEYVTNLAVLEAAEQALRVKIGDVDGDGNITAADALEVLKSVVGKVTLNADQFIAADTDGNGKADAADALNILKKVVGKINEFPVEQQ